jgi:hypothetical protein
MKSDGLIIAIIRNAAGHAPAALSERLEEEWLADLSERYGTFVPGSVVLQRALP